MAFTDKEKDYFRSMSVCILSPITLSDGLPKWIQSMVNMVAYSHEQGIRVRQFGYTYRQVVDWARNELARAVRDYVDPGTGEKYSHVLWLDSDHAFNPDLCTHLARHMCANPEIDAVSALYFGRHKPLPVVYVKDGNPDEYTHYTLLWPPAGLFQCDAVGFGSLLMRRDVFDRVPEPWFTLDYRAGEDVAFCVEAKKHGIKFFCDGAYTLGHIGEPPIVTRKDYERHLEDNAEEYKDKIKVRLGGEEIKT